MYFFTMYRDGKLEPPIKKNKNEHTEMDYLTSIKKEYKSEYKKNKIVKVKNSLLKLEKYFKELKEKNKS